VAWAASRQLAHWLQPDAGQVHHGSGYVGQARVVGSVTVISLLHGPWEFRFVRIDSLAPQVGDVTLRVAGWASNPGETFVEPVLDDALLSPCDAGVNQPKSVNPLGTVSVPFVVFPARCGEWSVSLLTLGGAGRPTTCHRAAINPVANGWQIAVTWPNGRQTVTVVADSGTGPTQPAATSSKGNK